MSISAKPLTNFELETKIRVIIKELLEATSNKYEMAEAQTVVVQSANRRL
jgi:predicted PilT family ATPase